jgi:hypothetical protein
MIGKTASDHLYPYRLLKHAMLACLQGAGVGVGLLAEGYMVTNKKGIYGNISQV